MGERHRERVEAEAQAKKALQDRDAASKEKDAADLKNLNQISKIKQISLQEKISAEQKRWKWREIQPEQKSTTVSSKIFNASEKKARLVVKDLVKELSARQSVDILDYYKETVKEGTRSNELQEQAKQMGFTGTSSKLEKALARQQQAANAALNESQKQISDLEAMKKRMVHSLRIEPDFHRET